MRSLRYRRALLYRRAQRAHCTTLMALITPGLCAPQDVIQRLAFSKQGVVALMSREDFVCVACKAWVRKDQICETVRAAPPPR